MGSDELVARCRTYAKDGQRALPSWARASFRDCAHEIERLTAQLAEARESERAATEREAQAKLDGVRAGIEAMRQSVEEVEGKGLADYCAGALSAEAIAKGEG